MPRTLALATAILLAFASLRGYGADAVGVVTIADGNLLVYRGAARFQVLPGVHVSSGDILEVGESGFLRVELIDRTDVQLGARTSAMINPGGLANPKQTERSVYLLKGWMKVASDRRDRQAPGMEVRSPIIELPANSAIIVLHISSEEATVFDQQGDTRILEAHNSDASRAVNLRQGDLYHRKAGWKGTIDRAGMEAFLHDLPRPFVDTLPPLSGRFSAKDDKGPAPAPDFRYADVEEWINSESPLRKQFVERWRTKAENPAFRSALMTNMPAHPEWDPVLFPEKYRPKSPKLEAEQPAGSYAPDIEELNRLLRRAAGSPEASVRPVPQ